MLFQIVNYSIKENLEYNEKYFGCIDYERSENVTYVDLTFYNFNAQCIWKTGRSGCSRHLGNHEDLFSPGISSAGADRNGRMRIDVYSPSGAGGSRNRGVGKSFGINGFKIK